MIAKLEKSEMLNTWECKFQQPFKGIIILTTMFVFLRKHDFSLRKISRAFPISLRDHTHSGILDDITVRWNFPSRGSLTLSPG
jgi:hypothetical protein